MPNNNSQFNREHKIEFGLVVTETWTVRNEVKSFPADSVLTYARNEDQAGKRKKRNNSKFFRSPFLPANQRVHVESACCGMGRLLLFTKNSRRETAFFKKKNFRQLII